MFSHNGPSGVCHWQYLRERRAAASTYKFLTYFPGGAILLDFVVVHDGGKLRAGGR